MISAKEKGTPLPTAIVTSDDMQALGVLKAMRKMNVSGIAVTGFNNVPISLYQNESFTSVDVNASKLGFFAAKLLIGKIEGRKNLPTHYIVPTNLVEVKPFY
jgi:DNA-binding LacI/PurR family transcriptional regulator